MLLHSEDGDGKQEQKYKDSYERVDGQLVRGKHDFATTAAVKASIRKTFSNNLVRPIWEGRLNNVCGANYENLQGAFWRSSCQSKSPAPALSFSLMLGDTIAKLQNEINSLRHENQQLQTNALRWKSTSDKLVDQWEVEKSELTDRFLLLFNQHKARHLETRKELEALKANQQKMSRDHCSDFLKEKEAVIDHEDEHDFATYDDSLVERLAAGPNATKKSSSDSGGMLNLVQSQKQTRQILTREYWKLPTTKMCLAVMKMEMMQQTMKCH